MRSVLLSTLILLFISGMVSGKAYKGGEVYSNESWKYGKMEMRMRMAKGGGILSTFFTYKNGSEVAGAFWEEIDIEVFGKDNAEIFQSNIITGNPRVHSEALHSPGYSMGDDFHTYTLEWTPDYVAWYIDGIEMKRDTGNQVASLTSSQSFRFNIWASSSAEWAGSFIDAALPAYQFVNWIRYSSYTPGTGDNGTNFTQQWRDDFDSFNTSRWSKADWTFDGNLCDFVPENVIVRDGMLVLAITREGQTGFTGTVPADQSSTGIFWKINSSIGSASVFPNPFTDEISFIVKAPFTKKMALEIRDMGGRVVFESGSYSTNENIVWRQNLSEGTFIIQAISDGKVWSAKVEKLK